MERIPFHWQAPYRPRPIASRVFGGLLMATVLAVVAFLLFGPWESQTQINRQTEDARLAEEPLKTKFLDPVKGPALIAARIHEFLSVKQGFLRVALSGDDLQAISLVPLSTPWSIVCDRSGLRLAIAGVLNPSGASWAEDHVRTINTGPDDGILIADAPFSKADCETVAAVAASTVKALLDQR